MSSHTSSEFPLPVVPQSARTNPGDTGTTLHGWQLWLGRALWLLITVLVLLSLTMLLRWNYILTYSEWVVNELRPVVGTVMDYSTFVRLVTWLEWLAAVTSLVMGLLVFWYKSAEPAGLFFSTILVLLTPMLLGANLEHWMMPLWLPWHKSLAQGLGILSILGFTLFFHLFPDGRFTPRWTRWIGWLAALLIPLSVYSFTIPNRLPAIIREDGWLLLAIFYVGSTLVAAYGQIYRYRHPAHAGQRQQIKWVVFTFGFYAVFLMWSFFFSFLPIPRWLHLVQFTLQLLVAWFIPLTIGFSILRYRLWQIELVVNRTLVYGLLTALVITLYGLVIALLSNLFQASSSTPVFILATAVIALLFEPLRRRLQRLVNRLMYGEQDDPLALLGKLGARLEETAAPEETLADFVTTLAHSLKLPYVAIEDETTGQPTAAYGHPPAAGLIQWPLTYQGKVVGQLRVAPRAAGERFTAGEQRLLENVARQAGAAVYAAQLTAHLQRSREQLVVAREEERRRIRRDLHDGLGPQLASLPLKLDAARNLMANDPQAAETLLVELKGQAQNAIQDIRRLVYDLRPPALDQLGLLPALREHAAGHSGNGLTIHVAAPTSLPPLPAAIEVAAYRITLEALTNVIRHAHAHTCTVTLTAGDQLRLEISDDGRGLPPNQANGVGLASMQERAAELGGTLTITSLPGQGTAVHATLPLTVEESKQLSVISQQ
jgi:signal transduction histidine kinase